MNILKMQHGAVSGEGLFSGVLVGVVLSVLYIKFDFALPGWLQPAATAEGYLITAAATMLTDDGQADELQREIAVRIQAQPDYFVSIDNELGHFISEEIVWRESTKRDVKLLQDMVKAMAARAERQPQPLADSLQRVLLSLPSRTKEKRALVYRFLQRRFPGLDDAQIVEQLKQLSLAELLQLRWPYARVVVASTEPGQVRVEIYNAEEQRLKTLLDAEIPAGQYRLVWDFRDEAGKQWASDGDYRFKIYKQEKLVRAAPMEKPKSIWQ